MLESLFKGKIYQFNKHEKLILKFFHLEFSLGIYKINSPEFSHSESNSHPNFERFIYFMGGL